MAVQTPLTERGFEKKTVLHVTSEDNWRGGENQIRLLIEGMSSKGWRSIVACPRGSALATWAAAHNVQHVAWRSSNDLDLLAAWNLRKILCKISPTIIATHSSRAHSMALLAKGKRNTASLFVYRRTNFPIRKTFANQWKFHNLKISGFIAISAAIARSLCNFGIEDQKIRTIKSAVDLQPFQQLARGDCRTAILKSLNIAGEPLLIGFAGRIEHSKGIDSLVTAFLKLRLSRPCHLLIAGEGPLQSTLQAQIDQAGGSHTVHFLGFLPSTAEFMKSLDVFCLPSLQEGLGTVVLEAIAASTFCCGSNVGGIPEMIVDGRTGLLFEPRSVESLMNVLQRACSDESLRASCITNAKEILQQHRIEKLVTETMRAYG